MSPEKIDTRTMVFELNDEKSTPTAEFLRPVTESDLPKSLLIRISKQDYIAASCLPVDGKAEVAVSH